ncbi:MAG: sugar phosphate isomerase/epimerase [Oscillospiraceae bacterium]|nr:sugar phosphate isomerase/epimerase [Oscillospiraceae bacterium]
MNKIIMHINYGEVAQNSYGSRMIDDICAVAANIGFDGIEFRGSLPKELASLSFREYAEQIAKEKKKYGLSRIMFGIGVAGCTGVTAEERKKVISGAVEQAYIASELCGTTLCNVWTSNFKSTIPTAAAQSYEFHGSAAATPEAWEEYVYTFKCIGNELEKLGVRLALETHMNRIHDVPAACKKFVDLIDSPMIGLNMDYGNTVYFPERPSVEQTIDLYGDKLFYVHLKNSVSVPGTQMRMPTSLSGGEINHREYFKKLCDVGFEGPIGIEAPRPGDRILYAKEDFEYFKSITTSL